MKMPLAPPPLPRLIRERLEKLPDLLSSGIGKKPENKYLHWSKLKHIEPPEGFSSEDWWLAIKLTRGSVRHSLPPRGQGGPAVLP